MIIGFSGKKISIVEIVCSIIILTVLIIMAISGVTSLIGKYNVDISKQEEELIVAKTEEYFMKNFNSNIVVGEYYDVSLLELKKSNFLDIDLADECIENSYISVYVIDHDKYTYVPHIRCFMNSTADSDDNQPIITASVTDNIISYNMLASRNLEGKIQFDYYQFTIYKNDNLVYDSGNIELKDKEYDLRLDLAKYVSDFSDIKVILSVRNNVGAYVDNLVTM